MLYETRDYLIYPVVNAQNLIAANFPVLTEENTAQMQEIYGNTATAVNRDIIWPSFASVYEKNHLGLTCCWRRSLITAVQQNQMAVC